MTKFEIKLTMLALMPEESVEEIEKKYQWAMQDYEAEVKLSTVTQFKPMN